jgi:hypothetical protein
MRTSPKTVNNFLSFTTKNGDCLEWTRCFNSDGYPRCKWNDDANGKVHRIVYQLQHPDTDISNLVVRHSCDNIKCINPEHLEHGTSADNMYDRDVRGRHGMAKLSAKKAAEIRLMKKEYPDMTQKELGAMFGVNYRTISYVLNNKTWVWMNKA